MGKFKNLINRNSDSIIKDRGERIEKGAKAAMETLLAKLDSSQMSMEDEILVMLDQSPDNRYSLEVGKKFDATSWVEEYHTKSVKLALLKEERRVAEENYKELFGEDEKVGKRKDK